MKVVPIHFGGSTPAPATLTPEQTLALRAALSQQFPAQVASGGSWSNLSTGAKVGLGVAGVVLVGLVVYAARKAK